MAVKTITITEDAYTHLASLKETNESFSDVVCRITGKSSLLELAGILTKKETEEIKSAIKHTRREMGFRMKRIAQKLK